jgi:hypothetical protein
MMHVQVSLVSADRRVLAGCLGYLEHGPARCWRVARLR